MGGSGGPGERKGGEQGEQSFVYMGFKGAALDLARGRAPRGSGPHCLQRRGLSGRHTEPCTRGIACPRAACLTCDWTSLPQGQRPPPEIPAPFMTSQDTGFPPHPPTPHTGAAFVFFSPVLVDQGHCFLIRVSSATPVAIALFLLIPFFPSINSHGYSLQLAMSKKCKKPPFNLTQLIAILTSAS